MWEHLGETIAALSADDTMRCVIVRGAGEKAFSPGNDIGEFATARANKAQAIEYGSAMHRTAAALAACRHPLVAQIHGICVGGGLEIAALCDLRICGTGSRFGAPIKNLGLVMAYPEMAPLVRLVGPAVALEILLEGRVFDARRSAREGPRHARRRRTTRWRTRRAQPRSASPRARRSSRAGTRSSRAGSPTRGRSSPTSTTRRSTASTPRTSARATRRSSPSASPSSREDERSASALDGMRVLELAQIMAGPTCGVMLADLGADVVKVEKLPGGDDSRGYREPRVNGVSAPFLMLNRNKRGIALDLKSPRGRDVFMRLVRKADVVIENYRRDTMDKLGLGYEALAAENPALIYCAITGFGRDGPLADRGGFDLVAQGFRGTHGDHRRARAPAREERQSRCRTSTRACSPPSACSPRTRIACATGPRASSSTRRSSKPRCSRRTGTRRATSRPENRRARSARRTS